MDEERLLTVPDAAARLGVQRATIYAYVSRGLLPRRVGPDGRSSRFDPADVDRLAVRGRRASAADGADLLVHSSVTDVRHGRLRYRGYDATALAGSYSFEQVAELLWTGELGDHPVWPAQPVAADRSRRALAALPEHAAPLERLRVIASVTGAGDPLRADLRADAVRAAGRVLLTALVEGLAGPAPPPGAPAPLASRLWGRIASGRPQPGLVECLDAALVLLADHELAASTVAARVAASARSDPYAVVSAGLATVSGSLHGAATLAVERLLAGIATPRDAGPAIAADLRHRDRLPGFGHFLYPSGDPRAERLLDLLEGLEGPAASGSALETIAAVRTVARERGLPPPNVDFALAAFTRAAGMPLGASEAIFGLARCAGWIAHALEQYEHGHLIRPRAVYVGPDPRPLPDPAQ